MSAEVPQNSSPHARWVAEITLYEREAQGFTEAGKRIIKRYKDKRAARDQKTKFNAFWSNVQTLIPALYSKNPKVNVERRFQDDDDLGRYASEVLERATSYFTETEKFFDVMRQSVIDRLIPGRGTAWVRYVPHFKDKEFPDDTEITDDVDPEQELDYEEVITDYVHWQDFGHTWARTWEECGAVWRIVYMTREQLEGRFEDGKEVPLDYTAQKTNDENVNEVKKKATIYEIWDKETKKALWLHKEFPKMLDERDDPLKLTDFFPCPKPLFATLANDSLFPVADYDEYKDQARELDDLTARIGSITKSLKVAGVYDASAEGVQRLLAEGIENQMVPVEQWAMLAEKGGMAGVMSFLPMKEIAETLLTIYEARDKTKQDLYEISGMADIIRGASDPNETATASNIKSKFATLRLDSMQGDVARFARDLVRIQGEIIASHFSQETIQQISGVKLLTKQQKDAIQQAMAQKQQQYQQTAMQAQQAGQQPPPPPPEPPDEIQELLDAPTWEEVYGLLSNDELRCFRIDIETDSTIKIDQDSERDQRTQLIGEIGSFMQQAAAMPPEMVPLLMEVLMFGLNGFKIGKDLEGAFKLAQKKLQKAADNPVAKPDPEMQKAQMQQQTDQQKLAAEQQAEQAKAQRETQAQAADQQNEQIKLATEVQLKREDMDNQLKLKAMELEHQKTVEAAKLENAHKLKNIDAKSSERIARLSAKPGTETEMETDDSEAMGQDEPTKLDLFLHKMDHMTQAHQAQSQDIAKAVHAMAQSVSQSHEVLKKVAAPKKVIRDAHGRVAGVE